MEVEVSDSGSSAPNDPKRKRPAKLFHKKSRTGCQQCRNRRVKCNEAKPICNNCERLDLTCVYDRLLLDGTASPNPADGMRQRHRAIEASDPPESEHRRRLELQLYNQFITETGRSLSVGDDALQTWVMPISRLALQSDALLYSIYCVSALHLASRDPINKDCHLDICHTYFNMALREHTVEITKFSSDTMDSILFTSSFIRYFDFVMLQERPLAPYSPPTEWMRVASSSSVIFEQAVELSRDTPDSLSRMLFSALDLCEAGGVGQEYGQSLMHLLQRQEYYQLTEPWSPEIQNAYESTIRYIGFVWNAMNHNEKPSRVAKKLILFAQMVDKHFITLLEEQRPRALVILAHYFSLLSMIRGIWWNNGIGEREVRAIAVAIPNEWRGLMSWPLSIVEQQIVFTGEI